MAVRQRNEGLRKRCGCPRRRWGECSHPWHVNFKWKGRHYRLSLDRESTKDIRSRSDARAEFDRMTISLEREIPRSKRLQSEEDEQRLLHAASPHLHAVIVAMLETACRPGEILSLQWTDVNLERGELTIRASKSKTRTERILPVSARLRGLLEMRRCDPAGNEFGPDAYVFGDEAGRQVTSVRSEWERVREKAGVADFHLADL